MFMKTLRAAKRFSAPCRALSATGCWLIGMLPMVAEASEPLVLVDQGKATAAIVVGSTASSTEQFAAAELQAYLKKLSGVELKIVEEDQQPEGARIVLGTPDSNRLMDAVRTDTLELDAQGFLIKRQDQALMIAAKSKIGVLYGVYSFLEELGVRWYQPGEEGEVVPHLKTVKASGKRRLENPSFRWRGIQLSITDQPFLLWAVRNRLNLIEARGCPLDSYPNGAEIRERFGLQLHSFNHGYPDAYIPREEMEAHAEWRTLHNGERLPAQSGVCVTHAGLRARLAPAMIRAAENYPDRKSLGLTPNDIDVQPCECEGCKTLQESFASARRPIAFAGKPDYSSLDFWFVNETAKELKKALPEHLVFSAAYANFINSPPFSLEDNVVVTYAPLHYRCFTHSLDDDNCLDNRRHADNIRCWGTQAKQLLLWDYPCVGVTPVRLARDLRFLRRNRFQGVWTQAGMDDNGETALEFSTRDWTRLWYYALLRLGWNVNTDVAELLREYFAGLYGNAGEPLQRVYEVYLQALERWPGDWEYGHHPIQMCDEDLQRIESLLEEAGKRLRSESDARIRSRGLAAMSRIERIVLEVRGHWNALRGASSRNLLKIPSGSADITVDGRIISGEWDGAVQIKDFYPTVIDAWPEMVGHQTECRMRADGENLYLFVDLEEADLKKEFPSAKEGRIVFAEDFEQDSPSPGEQRLTSWSHVACPGSAIRFGEGRESRKAVEMGYGEGLLLKALPAGCQRIGFWLWDPAGQGFGSAVAEALTRHHWERGFVTWLMLGIEAQGTPKEYFWFCRSPDFRGQGGAGVTRTQGWHRCEFALKEGKCHLSVDGREAGGFPMYAMGAFNLRAPWWQWSGSPAPRFDRIEMVEFTQEDWIRHVRAANSVKMDLDVNLDGKSDLRFQVDGSGKAAAYTVSANGAAPWNGVWRRAVAPTRRGLGIELALPLKALGISADSVLGFCAVRERGEPGLGSGIIPEYKSPAKFPRLALGNPKPVRTPAGYPLAVAYSYSQEPDYFPDKARERLVDGAWEKVSDGTEWRNARDVAVICDLGTEHKVNKVALKTLTRHSCTRRMDIAGTTCEISEDGDTWSMIGKGKMTGEAVCNEAVGRVFPREFAWDSGGMGGRYIRVKAISPEGCSPHLSEIEIWGDRGK